MKKLTVTQALGFIQDVLERGRTGSYDSNYDSATGAALRMEWDSFLLAHRQEIQDGKKYSLTSPEIQTLFPRKIFMFGGGSF